MPFDRDVNRTFEEATLQLASQELLKSFADRPSARGLTGDSVERNSALTFALAETTRSWSMTAAGELQGLACWRFLPWDSEVLRCRSSTIGGLWAKGDYLNQCHHLEAVLRACISDAEGHDDIRSLSLRLEEDALAALHAAETVGFRVIESFLTFRRRTDEEIPPEIRASLEHGSNFCVRPERPDEVEAVADLAAQTFQFARFFADPRIPEERARHSRREWMRNAFKGRAEAIYVAESEDRLVGFVLLQLKQGANGGRVGVIELIAVAPELSGRGIGKALVAQAILHFRASVPEIEVGTQGKNTRSIGLYHRIGFQMVRSELSLHRHR